MSLLSALLTLSTQNAPPVVVPDARATVAIWCPAECPDAQVDALTAALDEEHKMVRRLPRRAATRPVASLQVLSADAWGRWDPGALGEYGETLTDADRDVLARSPEVVVFSIAIDPMGDARLKNQRANLAALNFAEAVGGVPEDVATGEVYSREAWRAMRVDALGEEIMLYEQFTLLWSPEGDQVVTQGLRKLGLHELAMTGVSPELAGDVITTLALIATLEREGKTLDRNVSLSVAEVQNLADRSYLEAWMVWPGQEQGGQAGTGEAKVTLRNRVAAPGEPVGPILEVGVNGEYGSITAMAALFDQLWGWRGTAPPPPVEPAAEGWGGVQ